MSRPKFLILCGCVLGLISCNFVSRLLPGGVNPPEIIRHTKPDLPVISQPFADAGCSGENLYVIECTQDSPLKALGCDYLRLNGLTGGLSPGYAVADCMHRQESGLPPDPSRFEKTGCMMPVYRSTVVLVDGEFRLVNAPADFQALYAPIETEDEALGYAQIATGLHAVYGWDVDENSPNNYRVKRLEDTHIEKTEDGYLVSLFSGLEPLCGCGTHTLYARDVLVYEDGQVEVVRSEPVYDMEACID